MLQVLLLGPRPERDPPSGDLAYVQALIDNPPEGVEYVPYDEAIARGDLDITRKPSSLDALHVSDIGWLAFLAAQRPLRSRGVLFRERALVIRLRPGRFDLVHQHVFAARQVAAPRVPVVSSAGYPLSVLYHHREGWSTRRAAFAELVDLALARTTGTHHPGVWAPPGDVLTVYTRRFADHVHRTSGRAAQVVGQAIPDLPVPRAPLGRPLRRLGFIGYEAGRKGLDIAIGAFREVKRFVPSAELTVLTATRVPADDGVTVLDPVSNEAIVQEVLPTLDALVLPTRADCGAPATVMEALRAGVPVVTSDFDWLDERLAPPGVVRCASNEAAVAHALALFAELEVLDGARVAARRLYEDAFAPRHQHGTLLRAYEDALSRKRTA